MVRVRVRVRVRLGFGLGFGLGLELGLGLGLVRLRPAVGGRRACKGRQLGRAIARLQPGGRGRC